MYRWESAAGLALQLFAGIVVEHHAALAEAQLQHAALAAELVLADGVEAEGHIISVLVDGLRPKLAVLQKDLVDDEVSVLGMLVFAAKALPLRLVGI